MNIPNTLVIAILMGGFAAAQPARAATVERVYSNQGGPACQLSVPTTSSQVRPRATGMRNEGTVNEFVICQFPSNGTPFYQATVTLVTIDGNGHDVQCTGMDGTQLSGTIYSTKTSAVGTPGTPSFLRWYAADFQWPSGPTPTTFYRPEFSVTCLLPPGAAIQAVYGNYTENVGQ